MTKINKNRLFRIILNKRFDKNKIITYCIFVIMGALLFIIILFAFFVGGGWLIGKAIGSLFESKDNEYIDRSTTIIHHHHYHTNNVTNQSISVIDPETKEKIFELKSERQKDY